MLTLYKGGYDLANLTFLSKLIDDAIAQIPCAYNCSNCNHFKVCGDLNRLAKYLHMGIETWGGETNE